MSTLAPSLPENIEARLTPRMREGQKTEMGLQQLAKFVDRQPRVAHDVRHCYRVDRVVTRNRENPKSIGHPDALALPGDLKSGFLQSSHRIEMVDARQFRHDYAPTSTSRTICSRLMSSTTSRCSRSASRYCSAHLVRPRPANDIPAGPAQRRQSLLQTVGG
jgi:hypothetical protein